MTKIEAIAMLKRIQEPEAWEPQINQAAFEALSKEPSEDVISRQAAIRWVKAECNPYGKPTLDFESGKKVIEHLEWMPSAQPDLSRYSDRLWKAAYERGKAETQPELIRCKECKHRGETPIADGRYWCDIHDAFMYYCSDAERRTNE